MEAPGEKLLNKLWESLVDKGIGNLLKPWQMRREGRAAIDVRRDEMIEIAQAEREVEAVRRGDKSLQPNGQLVALPSSQNVSIPALDRPQAYAAIDYVEEVASQNSRAEAIRREIALAKAVLHAENELQNDQTPPTDAPISDDWLLRWRDCAASVSSEELQSIWGKVLAGEVKSPGRYSLRTLEFLRNLSQEEAKAIERISPFVVSGVIFRGNDSILTNEGIKFGDLLLLQELGMLAGVDSLGLQISWLSTDTTSFVRALTCHGKLLLITAPDTNKSLSLKVCTVTAIGKQVLQLGTFQANEKMLRAMGEAIKALGFDVQVGSYVPIDDSQLNAFNLTPL